MNISGFFVKNDSMNKLFLTRNPDLFQGEKNLNTNKEYFEGWYFKNTNNEKGISFIPGINIEGKKKKAFIQVITDDMSYFIQYPIDDFKFNVKPFRIQIGNNTFSKNGIHIDIKDDTKNLNIYGDIQYSKEKNICTSFFSPNIMGPFSYIPFMECNHAILNMQNHVKGFIHINSNQIRFNDGIGYIEKDWGCSFPKSYIWCQGNCFEKPDTSFMLSVADIPFKLFTFRGFICVLIIDNQEYKFTTYNNAHLLEYDANHNLLNITLKKGSYLLNVKSSYHAGLKLSAPVKGKMEKEIFESISSFITVTLKKKDQVIFSGTSTQCGVEIVPK